MPLGVCLAKCLLIVTMLLEDAQRGIPLDDFRPLESTTTGENQRTDDRVGDVFKRRHLRSPCSEIGDSKTRKTPPRICIKLLN